MRIIALLDLDYFFAQCEQLRNSKLKGKPVVIIVPTVREGTGAVSTSNYEARALKIRSGQALSLAKKLANPQTVFINVDIDYYKELSEKVFEIVDSFSEKVQQVSIDEAYFELPESEGFEKAVQICKKIKQKIKHEVGLTCSIGLSVNKLISKMAASIDKPDGLTLIKQNEIDSFLLGQKVKAIPGIGPKTEKVLEKYGVTTIETLRNHSLQELVEWFGKSKGVMIYEFGQGKDDREIEQTRERLQVSRIMTMEKDSKEYSFIVEKVDFLSERVYSQIKKQKKTFRTVTLIAVTDSIQTLTRSKTLTDTVNTLEELIQVEHDLLKEFLNENISPIRRIGVRVSNLDEDVGNQKKLFEF